MYERAGRRKSPWNLLLVPLCFGSAILIGYGCFRLVWAFHTALYPTHELKEYWKKGIRGLPAFWSFMMAASLLPGSLVVGFYLGNVLAWFIPGARRAFESEALGHAGTDFKSAQKTLFAIAKWVFPIGLGISLIAAACLKSLS
jgi:hypothetical protein